MSALHHGYCMFAVHHEKSLFDYFGNLESGKINNNCLLFWKSLEKVLNFGSKNLHEPLVEFFDDSWSVNFYQ